MVDNLVALDRALFLLINGWHCDVCDVLMYWASDRFVWLPLYLLFIYWIIRSFKTYAIAIIPFTLLLVAFTDQLSVHLFKDVFERLRPCHQIRFQEYIHLVQNHCGGSYGFVSSHSANAAGLATFLFFLLRRKTPGIKWLLFPWVCIVSYSRVYLGVHFPADVACGALFGACSGLLFYYAFKRVMVVI